MKKIMMNIGVCLLAFQSNIFMGKSSFAAVHTIEQDSGNGTQSAHTSNVFKILSVLDNKMTGQPLLVKAKGKVLTLNDQHTRLIASLSDQVPKERSTTRGDIAFLLLTALTILF